MSEPKTTGLARLREPFADNQISLLPKPTKKDNPKSNCDVCGGYHGQPSIHLDYVGHAALTDRLLEVDEKWNWEPLSYDETGLPRLDKTGGLWIKLTVCGMTRLGYGHAAYSDYKDPGSREKELIGDALRNAGMRFGAALDLWHKGDLHKIEDDEPPITQNTPTQSIIPRGETRIIQTKGDVPITPKIPPQVLGKTAPELLTELVDMATAKNLNEHQYKSALKRVTGKDTEDVDLSAEELRKCILYVSAIKVKK